MAEIKTPIFSRKATGKIAKSIIFRERWQRIFGLGFYFPGSKQKFIPSEKQKTQRSRYLQGAIAWHQLSPEEKKPYILRAKKLNLTGYNLFMQEFLKLPVLPEDYAILGKLVLGIAHLGKQP